MEAHVIIVAGGSGKRMGGDKPKQFLEVNGKNILHRTMERFLEWNPEVNIVLVLHPDWMDYWEQYCYQKGFTPPHRIAPSGEERFHSVKNGIDIIESSGGIIGVHDAVRPLVSVEAIQRCYDGAHQYGTAIPVVPVTSSLRVLTPDGSKAVPRKDYHVVQTPQCFTTQILKEAYAHPFDPDFTDDASVVEYNGKDIHLVEGNVENIKMTTPQDLRFLEQTH